MSILAAALPSGFQVKEGAIVGVHPQQQTLLVTGVRFTQDQIAVSSPQYEHEEHYTISCSLCSAAGDDNQSSRLAETYGLYASISVAIANNPRLNNTVRLATTRQLDYSPTYTPNAWSIGILNFEVQCQARVTSLT